jgi:CRP/FNR family transcriptional regulator
MRKKRQRELSEPVRCVDCASEMRCWGEATQARPPQVRVQRRAALEHGEILWHQGAAFTGLHLVASGSLRISETGPDGTELVIGFAFPGEMVGFDGIPQGLHTTSVRALEETVLCRVVWDPSGESDEQVPLEKCLLRRVSAMGRSAASRRPSRDASQALTAFLERLRRRIGEPQGERIVLRLPMTRAEIASYLGLAEETVSRAFRQLEAMQDLQVQGRTLSWPAG